MKKISIHGRQPDAAAKLNAVESRRYRENGAYRAWVRARVRQEARRRGRTMVVQFADGSSDPSFMDRGERLTESQSELLRLGWKKAARLVKAWAS